MWWSMKVDPGTGEEYIGVHRRGRALLLEPLLNKGSAFAPDERDALHLSGHLPAAVCTIDQQLDRTYENFCAKTTDLERFIYLTSLHDRNETLFFRLVLTHIDEMMPIIYTPVVGEACQKFSHIYRRARGLYLSIDQAGHLDRILRSYDRLPAVLVVTDGERILGLGDLGSGGMGIPIGKLCLYTLCAGIPPSQTLPVILDVGTDSEERLADPLYLGLRHRRVRGTAYQAFIDEFVAAVLAVFPHAVLQWEDLLKENAMRQLQRFRHRVASFNDDIQGTAAVLLAGVVNGVRLTGRMLEHQRLLLAGAGASATGIADLFVAALVERGMPVEEARRHVWMVDSRGLVVRGRPALEAFKAPFARDPEEITGWECRDIRTITLGEVVANAQPTILVGCSGNPGLFTEEIVRAMASCNERPMIFPLSNPTSRSECTAEEAIRWSDGRAIVATGSPFPAVEHQGNYRRIGQANNAFIFPGVGLGLWLSNAKQVTDAMFMDAAQALASQVAESDLAVSAVYPELRRIRDCSHAVACAVIRRAVREGQAPEELLDELENRVTRAMWFPAYRPMRYESAAAEESEAAGVMTGRSGKAHASA